LFSEITDGIMALNGAGQMVKLMTANEYIRGIKRWRGNYLTKSCDSVIIGNTFPHEHSHQNIADCIIHNPMKWVNDKFYME
jgi:hypothetical protein